MARPLLGVFAYLRKRPTSFVDPSVCQHVSARLLLTGFPWNFILGILLWKCFEDFHICSSVYCNSSLKKFNKMQQYADIYLLLNYSTCFGRPSRPSSRVHKTVVAGSGTDHTVWGASFLKRDQIRTGVGLTVPHQSLFGHVWGSLLPRQYDLYQRLQLQFYVLLMMGAMDARNM